MTGTVVSVLPVFLVGAHATEIRAELGFGAAGIGLAVAAFRLGAGVSAVPLGRATDRRGARSSMRAALAVAAVCSLLIATTVTSLLAFALILGLAGAAQSLSQPAANRMLANDVLPSQRGRAFGLKQTGPPAASMLAGLSVPVVALAFGWRGAFLAVPVLALLVLVGLRGRSPAARATARASSGLADLPDRSTIIVLSVAFALGNAASGALTAFYVDSSVLVGSTAERAASVLALGSSFAVVVRIIMGAVCDRMRHHQLRLAAGLLLVGSVATLPLGRVTATASSVAFIVAMAGVWGFNGVFWFALVDRFPHAPGRVTGAVTPVGLAGSVLGPLGFGVLADQFGYPMAWPAAAVAALAAALFMLAADMRLGTPEGTDGAPLRGL
jgi:sugar phosphate permease